MTLEVDSIHVTDSNRYTYDPAHLDGVAADSSVSRHSGRPFTGFASLSHSKTRQSFEWCSIVLGNDLLFLAMVLIDTQLTASEVLRTFHRDEPRESRDSSTVP